MAIIVPFDMPETCSDCKFEEALADCCLLNADYRPAECPLKPFPSEIIRCKDCKWLDEDCYQCRRQICAVFYENDFCSYAERRKNEDKRCSTIY